MGMGTEMVERKWEENWNSSLEEISVSRLAHWTICYFFIAILRDLTVLWLTREHACLYFVADILSLDLHCIFLFC